MQPFDPNIILGPFGRMIGYLTTDDAGNAAVLASEFDIDLYSHEFQKITPIRKANRGKKIFTKTAFRQPALRRRLINVQ
ncbi:hypothetical protein DL239_05595 [Sedimentitalea sp. CY04]|uniref:Uncharacterized protein n=1 Tax=Parasedimentitalea denitrificans TaxID=2211118 RepID=A0ABX0W738_9RHOB|nr:hypothetical protein [Sedimentitalea sp. CY04]